MVAAEQKKVFEQQVSILTDRITGYETAIRTLTIKDSATVAGYEWQIRMMREQRAELERIIRKERRKRFFTGLGGVVTTGIVTYLLITK